MVVSHVYSNTNADATGTLTIWNGATTSTVAATNLVRPSDWNSAHNQLYTITGNTLGSSTLSGTNIVFGGAHGITLEASSAAGAATLWVNGPPTLSQYHNHPDGIMQQVTHGNGTIQFQAMSVYAPLQWSRAEFYIRHTNASNSTGTVSLSQRMGIYTRNGSSLSLLTSTSTSLSFNFSGTVGNWSLISGIRNFSIPMTYTLQPGQYWVGIQSSSATAGTNASLSAMCKTRETLSYVGRFSSSANATNQMYPGWGYYTSTTTVLPGVVPFASIIGTAASASRDPVFALIDGTFV